ncbi:MAG: tRNA (adenine-N1)-methyltransferase [Nitrososphaerota archaeon]|nr:tRNA (adenine-N1)-methyltransferase [Nitrososphaerota archaeon]MDG6912610.1 tRNA (adenine-N1)-methyltransferase [Nitrososphaerota archaeon]MDG6937121.1 tRNA (adenine-N1)-methyltransferase [Nitrososphaerota archaeon]MDG6969832.1 tRNA (adenine-N1)-methyltransferase [Nitrososphaerota archaeon]MDG6972363.1 tRNA (adenine-N1)-methyltransferase [Nitrososphaerota archaeon]
MDSIGEDSYLLVYRDRRRRWLVRPKDTPKLHTHLGILDVSSLIGRGYGIKVTTTMGDELTILRPTIEDMVMKLARKTQVIYPKDLGLMALKLGVHSGSKVIETGTGSGATTALMAYLVQPSGMVYTYDLNPEFQGVAKKNIEKLGLSPYVTFKAGDSRLGFEEEDFDAGILDVGDPWEVVQSMKRALKPSASMAAVTPTTNQAEKLVAKMKEEGFVAIETMEILLRHLEARVGMTRPSNIMVGHTAYLTFGRATRSAASS